MSRKWTTFGEGSDGSDKPKPFTTSTPIPETEEQTQGEGPPEFHLSGIGVEEESDLDISNITDELMSLMFEPQEEAQGQEVSQMIDQFFQDPEAEQSSEGESSSASTSRLFDKWLSTSGSSFGEASASGPSTSSAQVSQICTPEEANDFYFNNGIPLHLEDIDLEICRNRTPSYLFTKHIGFGSFGNVYEAIEYKTPKKFAIKALKPRIPTPVKRAIDREISLAEHLKQNPHKNIVRFLDIFRCNDTIRGYIVTELAPLGDLLTAVQQLNNQGHKVWVPQSPAVARHLIHGVAQGVQHLLTIGIVHCDIKLENILLIPRNQDWDALKHKNRLMAMTPKLTDFSNSLGFKPGEEILANIPLCSLFTSAPESYDKHYDAKVADVFSVGVCLLAILLGALPFVPRLPPNAFYEDWVRETKALKKDVHLIEQLCRQFDVDLRDVLLKLLDPIVYTRITIQQFLAHKWFRNTIRSQEFEDTSRGTTRFLTLERFSKDI